MPYLPWTVHSIALHKSQISDWAEHLQLYHVVLIVAYQKCPTVESNVPIYKLWADSLNKDKLATLSQMEYFIHNPIAFRYFILVFILNIPKENHVPFQSVRWGGMYPTCCTGHFASKNWQKNGLFYLILLHTEIYTVWPSFSHPNYFYPLQFLQIKYNYIIWPFLFFPPTFLICPLCSFQLILSFLKMLLYIHTFAYKVPITTCWVCLMVLAYMWLQVDHLV